MKDWEYLDWCKMWILELARVTKSTGSIFLHPYGPLVSDV
ncbi:site-specific DNA-methyltransferase [Candidatus Endomicrobiellum trichonymphae]|nr:site-specific DNA-methyltransferase [Candidatus Endomicrobium trichonymphae]